MKILHTADLHLGKKLGKASRLDEQCDIVKEIADIADERDVDVILIAGDIFDASVPPSDAERVFYKSILTLSERGRAVIALAGNHDDEKRLCAAKPLADLQGIVLAGELDYTALAAENFGETVPPASLLEVADAAEFLKKQRVKLVGKYGGVTAVKGDERVNIALVPYPSEARILRWATDAGTSPDYTVEFADRVKTVIDKACEIFDDNYNILCTHLFLTKSPSDALGGLVALPTDILPTKADYVALGHVHKRYTVTKTPLAVYPGSPLQYAYDETRDKSVTLIDTRARSVTPVPLGSGRKLTETDADSYESCMQKLDFYSGDYVRIKYGGEPLAKDETANIKAHPAFNDFVIVSNASHGSKTERRAHLSDDEIFELYYTHKKGTTPSAELKAAFKQLMEAESEAD